MGEFTGQKGRDILIKIDTIRLRITKPEVTVWLEEEFFAENRFDTAAINVHCRTRIALSEIWRFT